MIIAGGHGLFELDHNTSDSEDDDEYRKFIDLTIIPNLLREIIKVKELLPEDLSPIRYKLSKSFVNKQQTIKTIIKSECYFHLWFICSLLKFITTDNEKKIDSNLRKQIENYLREINIVSPQLFEMSNSNTEQLNHLKRLWDTLPDNFNYLGDNINLDVVKALLKWIPQPSAITIRADDNKSLLFKLRMEDLTKNGIYPTCKGIRVLDIKLGAIKISPYYDTEKCVRQWRKSIDERMPLYGFKLCGIGSDDSSNRANDKNNLPWLKFHSDYEFWRSFIIEDSLLNSFVVNNEKSMARIKSILGQLYDLQQDFSNNSNLILASCSLLFVCHLSTDDVTLKLIDMAHAHQTGTNNLVLLNISDQEYNDMMHMYHTIPIMSINDKSTSCYDEMKYNVLEKSQTILDQICVNSFFKGLVIIRRIFSEMAEIIEPNSINNFNKEVKGYFTYDQTIEYLTKLLNKSLHLP